MGDLGDKDLSDVFVKLQVPNNKDQKSTIVKNTENPEWNEEFLMNVGDALRDKLRVSVEDYDPMINDQIGVVEIDIIDVVNATNSCIEDKAFDVVGSKYGWLYLDLLYS